MFQKMFGSLPENVDTKIIEIIKNGAKESLKRLDNETGIGKDDIVKSFRIDDIKVLSFASPRNRFGLIKCYYQDYLIINHTVKERSAFINSNWFYFNGNNVKRFFPKPIFFNIRSFFGCFLFGSLSCYDKKISRKRK